MANISDIQGTSKLAKALDSGFFAGQFALPSLSGVPFWQLEGLLLMTTLAQSPIFAASGGSFLLETRIPDDVFTPEDMTEEQKQIAATAARFAREEILPAAA